MRKKIFALAFSLAPICFAEPLLARYIENDVSLKTLALEARKAELSLKGAAIDNGFAVKLSTGSVTLAVADGGLAVEFNPSMSLSVPRLSNLGASASSKIKAGNGGSGHEDTKLSVSADIISGALMERKVAMMDAERALLKAERALRDRTVEVEREFYTELKKLFTTAIEIVDAENRRYDDSLDFEEVKAKGFSPSSAKYRQAELKVVSDGRDVDTKTRDLERDCAIFAAKCSVDDGSDVSPENFLPREIPDAAPLDVLSFPRSSFKKIEEAEWGVERGAAVRAADRNFSLGAAAGYTFSNSRSAGVSKSDTVDAEIDAGWKGLEIGAGVSVPVQDAARPIFVFSASVDPSAMRKGKIKSLSKECDEKMEALALKSAADDYDNAVVERQRSLADILWRRESDGRTYEMYDALERDLRESMEAGVARASEHNNAAANKERFRVELLSDAIDLIICNDTTSLLFCDDLASVGEEAGD